jgi:beta-glucosidase
MDILSKTNAMDDSKRGRFVSRQSSWRNESGLSILVAFLAFLIFPTPGRAQQPAWMDKSLTPARRADLLIAAMTLDQKIQQLHGQGGDIPEVPECGRGMRHIPGIPELKIPTFRITNGPLGVGAGDCSPQDKATAAPVSLALAASFDKSIAESFGKMAGAEAITLGLHELEMPGMDMGRVPQGGRNFEYLGEDPYLAGAIAANIIKGVQSQGVMAMAKHYVLNDQEASRNQVSVIIDDRPLHELYLLPFEMSVKDGNVASIMCSYNRIAGVYACEEPYVLNKVLREQWGFKGYVQSDFGATHSTAPALNAGLDLEMQSGRYFTPEAIRKALEDGSLKMAAIDQALKRRYTESFKAGIFDRPIQHGKIDAAANGALARSFGEQTSVLLKNSGLLPLSASALKSIALIGQGQYVKTAAVGGGGSSRVVPLYTVTPQQGLENVLKELNSSATVNLNVVADDLSDLSKAVDAAKAADVAIVFAGVYAAEGRDQATLALANKQDDMITAILAANPKTVLVMKDLAPPLMPWIDKAPAVLETFNAGEEEGNAVARILFGMVNPSAKLPMTYTRAAADLPANTPERYPGVATPAGYPKVEYSEELQMGYRWFQAQKKEPLFPFGFGLSYTTFKISGLQVTPKVSDGKKPVEVSFQIENTGKRDGAEVAQVYLGMPAAAAEPPKRLVAFEKVLLKPGEKRVVRIKLDPAASSHPFGAWDSKAQNWTVPVGEYQIYVGNSSANVAQSSAITLR